MQRKLKILCLHGYNADKNVLEYQMRHFRQVFGEVVEFVIIDAPFETPEEPVRQLKRFLAEGRTRFRSWLKFSSWNSSTSHSPDIVYGLEEVVEYLADVMKTQGPFDGVLAFSQGGIIFRHFLRITQEIDPEAFVSPVDSKKQVFQMPKFFMNVASPVFDMRFSYKGELFTQRTTVQFNFPSIHLHGTQDEFKANLTTHTLFDPASNPQVIDFDEGHKFPRQLTNESFDKLKAFVKARYEDKNGNDNEYDVEYSEYNFQVRIAEEQKA